jgi:hypothetical protein
MRANKGLARNPSEEENRDILSSGVDLLTDRSEKGYSPGL